jgi:hypothetical protein
MANVARWISANDIINRAAVEVGLNPVNDAYATPDPNFQSLRYLLNSCGQELVQEFDWNISMRSHEFTTQAGDSGVYDLPEDFSYMIDQTGWQQGSPGAAYPLLGPASPQWWSYLQASQLYSVTIYAWFRIKEGKLSLWPQPPPVGVPIRYEYISRAWVKAGDQADTYKDMATIPSDIVLYEPILIVKRLKLAFLQAKGFDTMKAEDEYEDALEAWKGKDQSSPKLSLTRGYPGYKMLDGYTNVPETGFGS